MPDSGGGLVSVARLHDKLRTATGEPRSARPRSAEGAALAPAAGEAAAGGYVDAYYAHDSDQDST